METTFYDDNNQSVKRMKTNMTLDLNGKEIFKNPELSFNLETPEIEKMFGQPQIITTPSYASNVLFPKSVTEEQKEYVQGFEKALNFLHENEDFNPATSNGMPYLLTNQNPYQVSSSSSNFTSEANPVIPLTVDTCSAQEISTSTYQTLNTVPNSSLLEASTINTSSYNSLMNSNQNYNTQNFQQYPHQPQNNYYPSQNLASQIKLEPYHIVPNSPSNNSYSSNSSSSQASPVNPNQNISPIDMNDQEQAKLERKRARNRIAATKCRNRKLERIQRLEDRVKELKDHNDSLVHSSKMLRDQVHKLKQAIIEHTKGGCQVMLTAKFLDFSSTIS